MKPNTLSLRILASCAILFASSVALAQQTQRQLYQLKTYTLANAEQDQLTDYFLEEAYIPALKRNGIKSVGVFKNHKKEGDTLMYTVVFYPIASLNQVASLDVALQKDEMFQKVGAPFITAAYDQPPFLRIESTLLKAFEKMPVMKSPELNGDRDKRVYELRSYESAAPGLYRKKVEMFNFGGEVDLFDSLGFNAVFYGEVLSGAHIWRPGMHYGSNSLIHPNGRNWKKSLNTSIP